MKTKVEIKTEKTKSGVLNTCDFINNDLTILVSQKIFDLEDLENQLNAELTLWGYTHIINNFEIIIN